LKQIGAPLDLPDSEEMTMSGMIANIFMPVPLASATLSYAAVLGLLLSGIGLYGVLAFSVSQRTREIGSRMAIGAEPRDVQRLVLREGLVLVVAGIAVGTVGAFASTRLLIGYLYGRGWCEGAARGAPGDRRASMSATSRVAGDASVCRSAWLTVTAAANLLGAVNHD
jgi:ABC-type antimicrobial peptide transport system permease subunit